MSFFNRKQTRSQTMLSSTNAPFIMSGGTIVTTSDWTNAKTAIKNSDVFAVVSKIANDVALLDFTSNNGQLVNVLNRPNSLVNGFSFWQTVVGEMLLTGNAYVWLHKTGNIINSMEIVDTASVMVVLLDNSEGLQYQVSFNDGRPTMIINQDEMLHFKCYSTVSGWSNPYVGLSPLYALSSELSTSELSNKLTVGTLKHAINPSTVLKVPQANLNAESKENIRKSFESMTSGDNVGRAIVLDQSIELDTISIPSDVAQFLNNVSVTKNEIAKAFNIPSSALNGTGDSQSSIEMLQGLYASSLQPYITEIESELMLKTGSQVGLDVEKIIDASYNTYTTKIINLVNANIITPEEAKSLLAKKGVI